MIEQAKFIYYPLGKALEKQTKTITDQVEKQVKACGEYGKQLFESVEFIKKGFSHLKNKKKYLLNFLIKDLLNLLI